MPPLTRQQAIQLAVQHHRAGRLREAESIYRQVLARVEDANALNLLGVICLGTARQDEGVDLLRRAVLKQPNLAAFRNNYAGGLRMVGQFDAAEREYRKAIELQPDLLEAHRNLAAVVQQLGRFEEAVGVYEAAARAIPASAEMQYLLANALAARNRGDEAMAAYRAAIHLDPDFDPAYSAMSNLFLTRRDIEAAMRACEKALSLRPNDVIALNNYGNALCFAGLTEQAVNAFHAALHSSAAPPFTYSNLGNALCDQARAVEAVAAYRESIRLDPTASRTHSNLLYHLFFADDISPQQMMADYRAWDQRFGQPLAGWVRPRSNAKKDGRIKVGYLSPDFRRHSVMYFFEPLLRHHDRSQFEVFCYADVIGRNEVTERLRGVAEHWIDVSALMDEGVAHRIASDGIDLLVDLAGHTDRARPLVFARRPALVQATYIGYPGTTGLSAMDYRITDGIADPPGKTDALHSERLVRLSRCFLCYQPPESSPPVAAPPAISNGYITFGSFNNLGKISSQTLRRWSGVLSAVPNSRLLLKSRSLGDRPTCERVRDLLARHDIPSARVDLHPQTSDLQAHLDWYSRVDIALDTMPYNGTTTTCEALWMGVPVVTLAGEMHHARVGATLLDGADMGEFVARSPEEFVRIATGLAEDLPALEMRRRSQRQKLHDSPLMDAPGLAKAIENAFRRMIHEKIAK